VSERSQEFRERLRPLEWREADGRPATATELADVAANVFDEMERESGSVGDLVEALRGIADAKPSQWDPEVRDQFREWAQSVARAALAKAGKR
jgi:hypothetical protein